MDVTALTQLIGTLGFPIAACIALFIQMNKINDNHREMETKLSDAITNNTHAIVELSSLIKGMINKNEY